MNGFFGGNLGYTTNNDASLGIEGGRHWDIDHGIVSLSGKANIGTNIFGGPISKSVGVEAGAILDIGNDAIFNLKTSASHAQIGGLPSRSSVNIQAGQQRMEDELMSMHMLVKHL